METAASHLVREVLTAEPGETPQRVIARLERGHLGSIDPIIILDAERRPIGTLPLARLFTLERDRPIGIAINPSLPCVSVDTDQERAAHLALAHATDTVLVTDPAGRLLGVVPPRTLLGILRDEHVEDLHRLAGIQPEPGLAQRAIEEPAARRARHRLPWLLIGLGGSALATWMMASFEVALQKRVSLAFFVPGLVYLADAIGTQTEAITVRGLSVVHSPLRRVLGGELRTGLLVASVLAALACGAVLLVFQDPGLALTVGISLFLAGFAASALGFLLPWALFRLGRDPAFGSGPLATVIQDLVSILVYFAVSDLLLG